MNAIRANGSPELGYICPASGMLGNINLQLLLIKDIMGTYLQKKKIAVFHMLPSGGGIRATEQFATGLSEYFSIEIHRPAGGLPFRPGIDTPEIEYPYRSWKKPEGILRASGPVFLMSRLLSFKKVCLSAARRINASADAVVVHNTLPIAAPPILNFLDIPSLYFCYEYPRHIYESDIIRRTSSSLQYLALKPLEMLEKKIDRQAVADATGIAALSSYMKGRIEKIYKRDSAVIAPGVDTDFFSPDPGIPRKNFVLSVGALWPFKGHETVIRILGLIPAENRPALKITADREYPGYSEKLKSLSERLSVDVTINTQLSNRELRYLYQSARAVLCCQMKEPYGLVPLEAMACGTPVIAVEDGGFPDNIVHGETGFLFNGTAEAGAEMLAMLLNPANSRLINHTVEGARDFVFRERNLHSGIPDLVSLLEKL